MTRLLGLDKEQAAKVKHVLENTPPEGVEAAMNAILHAEQRDALLEDFGGASAEEEARS